jgi:hypothetical protein
MNSSPELDSPNTPEKAGRPIEGLHGQQFASARPIVLCDPIAITEVDGLLVGDDGRLADPADAASVVFAVARHLPERQAAEGVARADVLGDHGAVMDREILAFVDAIREASSARNQRRTRCGKSDDVRRHAFLPANTEVLV